MNRMSERDPRQVASAVIDPGEKLLWAGEPAADVMIRMRLGRWWAWTVTGLSLPLVTYWWAARSGRLQLPRTDAMLVPSFLVPVAVILIGIPALMAFTSWRYRRYARSLSYVMTDRRLLVLEHGKIVDDYPPERLSRITVRHRAPGLGDVVFGRHYYADSGMQRTRDPVVRERRVVAFKALPDPDAMRQRVEDWLEERRREAVAAHGVAAAEAGSRSDAGRAETPASDPAVQRTQGGGTGLVVALPVVWKVEVRRKAHPRGRTFVDIEAWRRPEDADDWNVVRGEGPFHSSVEVEVFETPPTVDFKKTLGGRMAAAVGGKVVASEERLEIGGIPGFSVTRRREIQVDAKTGQAVIGASALLERHTVLHDGHVQIYVVSTWPEEPPELEHLVDAVVRSVRVE